MIIGLLLLLSAKVLLGGDGVVSPYSFYDSRIDTSRTFYVSIFGDFGLHRVANKIDEYDSVSWEHLRHLSDFLENLGLLIGNLEIVRPGQICYNISFLKEFQVDGMSLANNHSGDGGDEYLKIIADSLLSRNIIPFGLYKCPYAEFGTNGQKIRILGFSESFDKPTDSTVYFCERKFSEVLNDFFSIGNIHIVFGHFGEASRYITKFERELSQRLIDQGADAVITCSYHMIKGYFHYNNSIAIIHPGDFIFFPTRPETYSYIPVLGFEDGIFVYFAAIFFDTGNNKYFRLLDEAESKKIAEKILQTSQADPTLAYRDDSAVRYILFGLKNIFNPEILLKVKVRHIKYVLMYFHYSGILYLFAAAVVIGGFLIIKFKSS